MTAKHGIGVWLALSLVCCGEQRSLAPRSRAWSGSQATGALMTGDIAFCSATLVAPDVLVTSGRCARAAMAWETTRFVWRQGERQFETSVRAGHLPKFQGGVTSEHTRWRPAVAPERHAAWRGLARFCHVKDLFALTCSAAARNCLDNVAPGLLKQAGAMGLADWGDVGWLGLDDAVPTDPAELLGGDAVATLHARTSLWRIGVSRPRRGMRAVPAHRYEHAYRLFEMSAQEVHAGPVRGPGIDDVGGALFAEIFDGNAWRMKLVGVASRPFVAHGDTSAGLIFTRLEPWSETTARVVDVLQRH